MTIEANADTPPEASVDAVPFEPGPDEAARLHFLVSVGFLFLALLLGVVLAIQAVEPRFLGGVEFFTFGRLQPAAINTFIYGWLTLALIGAIYFAVPRVTAAALALENQAKLALAIVAAGYLAGIVAIVLGFGEGRRYLEAPLWADAIVLVGLLGVARVVTASVRQAEILRPVHWYAVGAVWWLVLLHVSGNIPGVSGVTSELQAAFYRAGLVGLWLAAAGVGLAYFLIPRLTGREDIVGGQLSVIGFLSLAFVWALTSPADLIYTATPDWLETIGVVFSIALFIPVAAIFADIVGAMRRAWGRVSDRRAMHLVMAGAAAFVALPIINLVRALRAGNAIVGFTDWVGGYEALAIGGAATFWLLAYAAHAGPGLARAGTPAPMWQYRTLLVGLVTLVAASLYAGAQAGFVWVAGANSDAYDSVGDGFRNTVDALAGARLVRLVGYVVFTVALVWFLVGAVRRRSREGDAETEAAVEPEQEEPAALPMERSLGFGRLGTRVVALFVVALVLVVIAPAIDNDLREDSPLAESHRTYDPGSPEAEGRQIYLQEGCWACHTQAVRPIVTDVGLGPVSQPGDYVHETPAAFGSVRIGPDLMHFGSRAIEAAGDDPTAEAAPAEVVAQVAAHLADPRESRSWSIMPSYDYLSADELEALAAYLVSLR